MKESASLKMKQVSMFYEAFKIAGNGFHEWALSFHLTGRAFWNYLQAPMVLPGQNTAIYLQLENVTPVDTKAKIVDPNGCSDDIEVRDLGDHLYRIEFTPALDGPHAIAVFYKGQHVPG